MPHLTVHVLEEQLAGRESALISWLTDAVVSVYGDWAREIAVVQLVGMPAGRWGIGGRPASDAAPVATFGIRESAFDRSDAPELAARLVAAVTDALVAVLGETVRAGTTVELVGTLDGRFGVGGVLVQPMGQVSGQ